MGKKLPFGTLMAFNAQSAYRVRERTPLHLDPGEALAVVAMAALSIGGGEATAIAIERTIY